MLALTVGYSASCLVLAEPDPPGKPGCLHSEVVHSLCDRDDVELPGWVRRHRASRPVPLTDGRLKATPWTTQRMAQVPSACAAHNVWFDARSLDDYRVHGFR